MQSWLDLKGDNLQISRAHLWISEHCKVMVADFCIQTAAESDKTWRKNEIKTDQWHAAPQIRPVLQFVVSLHSVYILHSLYTDLLTIQVVFIYDLWLTSKHGNILFIGHPVHPHHKQNYVNVKKKWNYNGDIYHMKSTSQLRVPTKKMYESPHKSKVR